ncbi:MAG TPA: DUF3108 domain-containing protein [Longimicrobiaceae bacterium]|jgi:hypothetical protein|nr:DUF3108 domain-containing protein [Longimicrobiaceae bacterium]
MMKRFQIFPVRARLAPAAAALALLLGAATGAPAMQAPQRSAAAAPAVATVPFGPGEHAAYQVKLGGISVGSGAMRVTGIQHIDGHPTYHTRLEVSGGIPLARVDDTFESWIDVAGLFSRRFHQDQKEVRYQRKRTYHFFPEHRTWLRPGNGETGALPTSKPLDDVSFLYYARTLPLEVGKTYTLHQYFKEDGNPVILKVLRKERITVPAGTFETIVVRPIIKTKGLFSEGGEAEVYFSDDARRILVMMRSKVPLVGSLTLHLRSYTPGQPYTAGAAS